MVEVKTGDATRDGAALPDKIKGAGTAERMVNFLLNNGGIVHATPWLFFLAYAADDDERTLCIEYAYGDVKKLAAYGKYLLDTGRFDTVDFNRDFGREIYKDFIFPADRLVECLLRVGAREERREEP